MDGYSRRIFWLEVSNSNNDPAVIESYYLETLQRLGVTPRLLRSYNGTENTNLALLQTFFQYNNRLPSFKSYIYIWKKVPISASNHFGVIGVERVLIGGFPFLKK